VTTSNQNNTYREFKYSSKGSFYMHNEQ